MTEKYSGNELEKTSPSEAVRRSVMEVLRSNIAIDVKRRKDAGVEHINPNQSLEETSSGHCSYNSQSVLGELATKYPNLFEDMAIFMTHDIPETSPIFDNIQKDSYHAYFLVKGTDGIWYAGSPANHNMKMGSSEDTTYATTIYEDVKLENVIKKMKSRDKCPFPTEEQIITEMEKHRKKGKTFWISNNRGRDVVNYVHLGKGHDGEFFSRHNASVTKLYYPTINPLE